MGGSIVARDFPSETQTPPWTQVGVSVEIQYVELTCTACDLPCFAHRAKPLRRTGSEREYVVCPYCGQKLTQGHVIRFPRPLWSRIAWWRKRRQGRTLPAEVNGHDR